MRYFYFTGGIIFLAIGIIGIFLPLLPTTPFLLLAAFFFNRGSPKFHQWLLNHPVFGPPIQDWNKHRAIKIKYKILATSMLLLSGIYMLINERIPMLAKISFGILATVLLIYLWTRKSR